MSLFSQQERQEMYDKVQAQQPPKPKTKAEILVEVCRDFPDVTTRELSEASGMSTSWVRKQLRKNGIVPAKPVRGKKGQL
jgi:transposase